MVNFKINHYSKGEAFDFFPSIITKTNHHFCLLSFNSSNENESIKGIYELTNMTYDDIDLLLYIFNTLIKNAKFKYSDFV